MEYNFDKVISRRNIKSLKWREVDEGNEKLLPMALADIDFPCPKEVVAAIQKRALHETFGYTYVTTELEDAITDRVKRYFNWEIKREWIAFLPGVLDGITTGIRAFTNEGDGIIIQDPIYPPFKKITKANKRKIVYNSLVIDENKYKINFEELDCLCENNKLLLLCNPHNPSGRVWKEEELLKIAEIAKRHDVYIISDEIHADIILEDTKHISIASLNDDLRERTITLMSGSKTFNVPGLSQAFAIIPNDEMREAFNQLRVGMNKKNIFGLIALEECFNNGDTYVKELREYLRANLDYIMNYLETKIPEIKVLRPEGTYLLWMDMSKLGMTREELNKFIRDKVCLELNEGFIFSESYDKYQRMNYACPRSYIEEALKRLEESIKELR